MLKGSGSTELNSLLGEYKPDSKVRFVQRSDETLRQFKTRMHNECQNAISVVESTKSHNVVKDYMRAKKMDKNADKVERINAAEKKKRERLQLLKQKKNDKKDEKTLAKAERAALVDRVEFGETVHAPPTFSRLPRGHEKTGKKFSLGEAVAYFRQRLLLLQDSHRLDTQLSCRLLKRSHLL